MRVDKKECIRMLNFLSILIGRFAHIVQNQMWGEKRLEKKNHNHTEVWVLVIYYYDIDKQENYPSQVKGW